MTSCLYKKEPQTVHVQQVIFIYIWFLFLFIKFFWGGSEVQTKYKEKVKEMKKKIIESYWWSQHVSFSNFILDISILRNANSVQLEALSAKK